MPPLLILMIYPIPSTGKLFEEIGSEGDSMNLFVPSATSQQTLALFKVNNRNTRKSCEISSKLSIVVIKRCDWFLKFLNIVIK